MVVVEERIFSVVAFWEVYFLQLTSLDLANYFVVPFEPFPEREPVMIAAPPIDNYVSRWKSIENKAMADLIPLSIIEVYYKERLKYAEKHYRQESKAWKLWFAEHEVWIHFFRGIQFHGLEPKRSGSGPTPITSTQNLQVPVGPLSSAKRHPNALPTSDSIDIPGFSTIYQHQEKVMEEKAKKRGIRREYVDIPLLTLENIYSMRER